MRKASFSLEAEIASEHPVYAGGEAMWKTGLFGGTEVDALFGSS